LHSPHLFLLHFEGYIAVDKRTASFISSFCSSLICAIAFAGPACCCD
jgi:hypothetical protein